jgi:hypothetical protein
MQAQQQAQRQAEAQRQAAQQRAINEQRERARLDYLHQMKMNERLAPTAAAASAAAGAGGSGNRQQQQQDFPSVSAQSHIISWVDSGDDLWRFVVYNYGAGTLTEVNVTDMTGTDWNLNNDDFGVHLKGHSLRFQNINVDSEDYNKYRIIFINAVGTVVADKMLDTSEDARYTERAIGFLGDLDGVATLYHYDGDNVRTHTFDMAVNSIEIDDGAEDDVTEDGSMVVEAPNNVNFFIARPNGDLVDVTEHLVNHSSYRYDYNTDFIIKLDSDRTTIRAISQEGTHLGNFDLTPFAMTSVNEGSLYGDNCAYYDFDSTGTRLVVSFDGDSGQYVSMTCSTAPNTYRLSYTERDWQSPVSSFGKSLIVSTMDGYGSDNIGTIATDLKLWWLPKGAIEFAHVDLSGFGTVSFVDGTKDFTGNRSFSLGENPMFMFAPEGSEIMIGFLKNDSTFATASTGILAASCSNVWGHNIGEHSFAVFDVGDNRIWQFYDEDSILAQTETTSTWDWGVDSSIYASRFGTLAVLDDTVVANSFVYTTEIGLTAGPTGQGDIYNEIPHAINTGISHEFQVITQFIPGEEANYYVEGFYVLSRAGLSDYTLFFGESPTYSYTVDAVKIGSEIVSFRLTEADTSFYRFMVYKIADMSLIDDYQPGDNLTDFNNTWDNRCYIQRVDGQVRDIRMVGVGGVQTLTLNATEYNREANDAVDNDDD